MLLEFVAVVRCVVARGTFDAGVAFSVWSATAVAFPNSYMVGSNVLVTLVGYLVPLSLPAGILVVTLLQVLAVGPHLAHAGNTAIACASLAEFFYRRHVKHDVYPGKP